MPAEGFQAWRFWRRWFGQRSETTAAKYLRKLGWRIVARNVSDTRGEIDLLALDGKKLVAVEVRSTAGSDPLKPAASVDLRKQRKLTGAVLRFLARRKLLGMTVRFDVLAIAWPPEAKTPEILHIRAAFEATGQHQMWS